MAHQLETPREALRHTVVRPAARPVAGPGGSLTRGAMLGGSLASALVGGALLVTHVGTVGVAGALFGTHMTVQGLLQLLTVPESRASAGVRALLFAGGGLVLLFGAVLLRGTVDTVFLLGLWTGCGWLLQGLTMAVAVTSDSVSHVFVYDDVLNAVIVSAGLFMTAFPFASLGQLTDVGSLVLLATGAIEAIAAVRRNPRTLRAID